MKTAGRRPDGENPGLIEWRRLADRKLTSDRTVERAARSSLYQKRWKKAKVDTESAKDRDGLRGIPFTADRDILKAQEGRAVRDFACGKIWAWFATSSQGERRKWIPYGKKDILQFMDRLARLGRLSGLKKGDLVLAIVPQAPRITSALPYLWMYADMREPGLGLEFIAGSIFMLGPRNNWLAFALRKQPDVLIARPSDALAVIEFLALAAGRPEARPRELFEKLRAGIFFGEPLGRFEKDISESFGLESFDCYISAEFPGLCAECSAHDGLHVWLDICIPEIIPQVELEREKAEPGYVPRALFLDQADSGATGEFVVTTFGEALPLIRYRTGDTVGVVSRLPCPCGLTHPRIKVLGRVEE
jgi:phenylacetate-CoA ligase